MRTKKELLILVRENLHLLGDSGLCELIFELWRNRVIDVDEYSYLDDYIDKYRPKRKKNPDWGWQPGRLKVRENWLNKQI